MKGLEKRFKGFRLWGFWAIGFEGFRVQGLGFEFKVCMSGKSK